MSESEAEIRTALELAFLEDMARIESWGVKLDAKEREGLKTLYRTAWIRGAKWANRNAVDVMTGP